MLSTGPGLFSHCVTIMLALRHILVFLQCIIAPDKNSRGINRAVMKRLVEMYRGTALGGRLPVYDGRHNLYTAGQLPFQQKEFTIVLQDEADMQAQGIP